MRHKKSSRAVDYGKPFCFYHVQTPENPLGTDCDIKIQAGEEHAKCPYSLIDIRYKMTREIFYVIKPCSQNRDGDCHHIARKGLKPELSDKLKAVPPEKKLERLIIMLIDEEE